MSVASAPRSTTHQVAPAAARAAVTRPAPARPAPAAAPAVRSSYLDRAPPLLRLDAPAPVTGSAGAPMAMPVRAALERSLGVGLDAVRVHTDSRAADVATELNARAFAYGTHIFLGPSETPTDLRLMAHETAHVVQQRGGAAVQRRGGAGGGGHDALEGEADRVAEAVVSGQPALVVGRTLPRPQFQFNWLRRAAGAVVGAVGDVAGAALRFIRERVNNIPGYSMLAFVLGRDPITQQPVERNAVNLIRAVMGLWPGGELIFQALQRYHIVDRVGAWLTEQLRTLGIAAGSIRGALERFISTLGAADILNPGGVFDRARRIFSEPIDRITGFVRGLAAGVLGFIRDAVLRPLAQLAQGTRGYDLIKLVLGRDPITGDPYPRTPENVIGGFMRLIGEEEKWRHLQESRAIPRAWAWFQQQLGILLGFVSQVPGLLIQALRSLQIGDLLDLPGTFRRMANVFGGFVGRFVSWAGNAAIQVMMFIFEALAPAAMPVLRRAASVIRTIVREPVRFVGNLVRAGLRGFEQFRNNIGTHLISGLVGWLTGALAGAGLQLPQRWDLRGILSLVLQILGLTWQNIRQKLLRHIPEPVLRGLETAFELIVILVREGPAAAWQKILEHLGNLQEMVFGQIREWVTRTVVGQAVIRIASMLNPAGAVIQAIIAIYNTIMFFRERAQQIADVVEAYFNSIAEIAAGNIGAAANRVEQTMARVVPVIISFLARLIGLGGISDTIRNIIARIRGPIDRALDRVVDWLVAQARRLGRMVAQAGVPQDAGTRLRLALQHATSAANRFAGRRVGEAVLRPLLGAIKLRYQLHTLDLISRSGRWMVRAIANPHAEAPTDALTEEGPPVHTTPAGEMILATPFQMGSVRHVLTTRASQAAVHVTMASNGDGSLVAKTAALIRAIEASTTIRRKESAVNKLNEILRQLTDYNVLLTEFARSMNVAYTARRPTSEFLRAYNNLMTQKIVWLAQNYHFTDLVFQTFIPHPLPDQRYIPEPVKGNIRDLLYERGSNWDTVRDGIVRRGVAAIDAEIDERIITPLLAGNVRVAQAAMTDMKRRGKVLEDASLSHFTRNVSYVTPRLGQYAVDHHPSLAEHWERGNGNKTSDAVRRSVVEGTRFSTLSLVTRRFNSQKGSYSLNNERNSFKENAWISPPFTSEMGKDIHGNINNQNLVTLNDYSLTYPDGTPYLPR